MLVSVGRGVHQTATTEHAPRSPTGAARVSSVSSLFVKSVFWLCRRTLWRAPTSVSLASPQGLCNRFLKCAMSHKIFSSAPTSPTIQQVWDGYSCRSVNRESHGNYTFSRNFQKHWILSVLNGRKEVSTSRSRINYVARKLIFGFKNCIFDGIWSYMGGDRVKYIWRPTRNPCKTWPSSALCSPSWHAGHGCRGGDRQNAADEVDDMRRVTTVSVSEEKGMELNDEANAWRQQRM